VFFANIKWNWTSNKYKKLRNAFMKNMLKWLFLTQILALGIYIGEFWVIFSVLKLLPNHWAIFSRKKFAQCHKISPKWRNFAQSGHPGAV
jgi:hypothetical protein